MTCYNYIVNELCINRDKPELLCNGKCYLMTQLSKSSEKESSNKENSTEIKYESQILFLQNTGGFIPLVFHLKSTISTHYKNLYYYLLVHSFFHPPPFYKNIF